MLRARKHRSILCNIFCDGVPLVIGQLVQLTCRQIRKTTQRYFSTTKQTTGLNRARKNVSVDVTLMFSVALND